MPQPGSPPPEIPIAESVWIENAILGAQPMPGEKIALMFTVPNGRRYIFPLDADGREALVKLMSGVQIFTPDQMPGRNGSPG